jgi:hypothetical protein
MGTPTRARSLPTRAAAPSPSIGMFTAPAMPGRAAVPPAPTPIRTGRTRQGRCCASSSSIRSRVSRGSQRAQVVPARRQISRISLSPSPTYLGALRSMARARIGKASCACLSGRALSGYLGEREDQLQPAQPADRPPHQRHEGRCRHGRGGLAISPTRSRQARYALAAPCCRRVPARSK